MKARNFVAKHLRLRSEPHAPKHGKHVSRAIAKRKFKKALEENEK